VAAARRRATSRAAALLLMAAAAAYSTPAALVAQNAAGAPGVTPLDTSRAAASRDPLRGNTNSLSALGASARGQQEAFERNHRLGLRFYNGGADATCEVPLGRICYWNNNGDVPPPAERSDAKLEREQLLELLGRAQAADPRDDWVSGMRVRYAVEGGFPEMALEAARLCAGTEWWCQALRGLALHNLNQHVAAAQAFDRALAAMPAEQRCAWTDITMWLDPVQHEPYKALGCEGRQARNARIFRLAQPLWMLPGNDVRNELFARRTVSRVHSLGRIPYDLQWGDDLLESQVRYGWPTAWSVQNGGVADPRPPQVIGHEPTPSYDFMPTVEAIDDPLSSQADDWDPKRKKARMRYSTRYAAGYGALPFQFARFRRGDTTVLAGAYRLMRELEMGRAPYTAGLTLDRLDGREPRTATKDSAGANGAVLVPFMAPTIASLEVLAPTSRRAARVRTVVQPLPADARLSDYLLLQRGDESPTPSLERNAGQAYGSLDIEGGTRIGIYWEMYRPASPSAPLQVSIRATRLGASFMQKLGASIGLSKALTPVSIRYNDNGRPDGGPGRSLTLNFPAVAAGDYQLTVLVSGAGVTDSTTQTIRVRPKR
jgi:tetratricopeptide (TPR) repeat protein